MGIKGSTLMHSGRRSKIYRAPILFSSRLDSIMCVCVGASTGREDLFGASPHMSAPSSMAAS